MNPRQVTLLYGIGGVVLLGALSALFMVEHRQLKKIQQDTEEARAEAERVGQELGLGPANAARASALEAELAVKRRLLPREIDVAAVHDRLLALRRTHGLSELTVTLTRDEQPGLWPAGSAAAFVPPAHPWLRPWTRYVGIAGRYGQILAFLNELERVNTLQLVHDLALVRAGDPAPGAIPLRAGFSLTLYAGSPDAAPSTPLSEAELRALLGAPHSLARGVTDDWAEHGVDWRTTPPASLPARNPFDPYVALTKAQPVGPVLDLDALERRFEALAAGARSTGEGFDAAAATLAGELGGVAPSDRGSAERWGALRGKLDVLKAGVGGARIALAEGERERVAIEGLAPDQRAAALVRLAALEKAIEADANSPLGTERAALAARVAALRAKVERIGQPDSAVLERARTQLAAMTASGAAGDLAAVQAAAPAILELAGRYPASTELATMAHDAADLAGRAKRLLAIAGSLRFTGTVVAGGVKLALVGGRRYRPGDRIEVEGESLEVIELDDARLVLGWKGLRALRAR